MSLEKEVDKKKERRPSRRGGESFSILHKQARWRKKSKLRGKKNFNQDPFTQKSTRPEVGPVRTESFGKQDDVQQKKRHPTLRKPSKEWGVAVKKRTSRSARRKISREGKTPKGRRGTTAAKSGRTVLAFLTDERNLAKKGEMNK